jgi:hypothetical protein
LNSTASTGEFLASNQTEKPLHRFCSYRLPGGVAIADGRKLISKQKGLRKGDVDVVIE